MTSREGGGSETAATLELRSSQRSLAEQIWTNCGVCAPLGAQATEVQRLVGAPLLRNIYQETHWTSGGVGTTPSAAIARQWRSRDEPTAEQGAASTPAGAT